MASNSHALANPQGDRQPHIYGASPYHYRHGGAIVNGKNPPWWTPELANNPDYPYTLSEFERDVGRWIAITKVQPPRQGPMIAMALGRAARSLADNIPDAILAHGAVTDLGDGQGHITRSGVTILLACLRKSFPEDLEARMLRCGLEFFGFTPTREELISSYGLQALFYASTAC